jgi:multicomponent Na+:H+ antiporter subunit E
MRQGRLAPSLASRSALLLGVWLLLTGARVGDVPTGLAATALGVWASLRLLPPAPASARPVALAALALRLLLQSVVAGADVARRALAPRLGVRPGVVAVRPRLSGRSRDVLCTITGVVPGTLPSGFDANGALLVHCLDVEAPVAARLEADEVRLARALGVALHG